MNQFKFRKRWRKVEEIWRFHCKMYDLFIDNTWYSESGAQEDLLQLDAFYLALISPLDRVRHTQVVSNCPVRRRVLS